MCRREKLEGYPLVSTARQAEVESSLAAAVLLTQLLPHSQISTGKLQITDCRLEITNFRQD
jgi:hypothetical protein